MVKRKFETIQTTVIGALEDGIAELEALRDELQEWFDNLPEQFQNGQRGEGIQSAIDNLESALNTIPSSIELPKDVELQVTVQQILPRSKRASLSRSDRCSNVCSAMSAASSVLLEWLDSNTEHENYDELKQAAEEMDSGAQEADSTEFPGMYG